MLFLLPLALLVAFLAVLIIMSTVNARNRANRQLQQASLRDRSANTLPTSSAADYFGYDDSALGLYATPDTAASSDFDQQDSLHLDQSLGDGT